MGRVASLKSTFGASNAPEQAGIFAKLEDDANSKQEAGGANLVLERTSSSSQAWSRRVSGGLAWSSEITS